MSSFSSYKKDKERFDGWRRYLLKEAKGDEPVGKGSLDEVFGKPAAAGEEQEQSLASKAAGSIGGILGKINSWWKKGNDAAKQKFCDVLLPAHLKKGGEIKTFGDLQAVLKCSINYDRGKSFLNSLSNFLPYASVVKDVIGKSSDVKDFALSMYQLPDGKRPPGGNLGKLDMDDAVAEIIDNNLEKEFLNWYIAKISSDNMMDKEFGEDWNITKEMAAWLKNTKDNRTIAGFEEE